MSYTALARKWRPRTFAELVGQEHVRRALVNALESGRVHHAFLFTGTRGVGKTTIARILAKCLNCETRRDAPSPAAVCASCREIDAGRFVDLIEVDAASRTKVDDTRELLDNVQYAPTRGRYKVYLIDEVHMLSTHSFNALLKTLEEPPPHVKFLLATTDPQKLPVTVLSRCLQFNLKRLPVAQIGTQLRHILDAGGRRVRRRGRGAGRAGGRRQPARCALAARSADRLRRRQGRARPRRARCSARSRAITWCASLELLAGGDSAALLRCAQALEEFAPGLRAGARCSSRGCWCASACARRSATTRAMSCTRRSCSSGWPRALAPEDVQLFYQTAIIGRRDLALAPDPRTRLRDDAAADARVPPARATTADIRPACRHRGWRRDCGWPP